MKRKLAVMPLLLVLGVAPLSGCRPSTSDLSSSLDRSDGMFGPSGDKPPHPILLIALDGLEWSLVLEMLREGRLSVIADLMNRGAYGTMVTTTPTLSPIIWTTIATGMSRQEHGIRAFIHKEQEAVDGIHPLYTSNDRRTKAFWNILTDVGMRVCTVGWWMTYPVEEVNGMMIAQVNTSTRQANLLGDGIWGGSLVTGQGLTGQVYPPDREEEILAVVPEIEKQLPERNRRIFGTFAGPLDPVGAALWSACRWSLRSDSIYRQLSLKLLAEEASFDLFAVYFGGTDVFAHRFWRYMYPTLYEREITPQEIANFGNVVKDYYDYMDGVVGELIAAAPPDSVVILLSDHGMRPCNREGTFQIELNMKDLNSGGHLGAPRAFFVACGPNVRPHPGNIPLADLTVEDLPRIGSIYSVLPTMLALLGLPIARDMAGEVLTQIIDSEYLSGYSGRTVDTYTPDNWYEQRTKTLSETQDLAERLEQLRSLGYIQGG